jgi:hypothetical protein
VGWLNVYAAIASVDRVMEVHSLIGFDFPVAKVAD